MEGAEVAKTIQVTSFPFTLTSTLNILCSHLHLLPFLQVVTSSRKPSLVEVLLQYVPTAPELSHQNTFPHGNF